MLRKHKYRIFVLVIVSDEIHDVLMSGIPTEEDLSTETMQQHDLHPDDVEHSTDDPLRETLVDPTDDDVDDDDETSNLYQLLQAEDSSNILEGSADDINFVSLLKII